MNYGDKRDFKKIDIYFAGDYFCSTTWAKSCKQAVQKFIESCENAKHSLAGSTLTQDRILKNKNLVKARFAK